MPRGIVLIVLLISLSVPTTSRADDPIFVLDWDGFTTLGDVLYGGDYDIVVADILSVRDSGATQADPPHVTIRVREVLRGSFPRGRHTIRWMPQPLYMPCDVGEEGNIRRWNTTAMEGPVAGQRMVLGGDVAPGYHEWGCSVFCRWPYSDSLRAEVLHQMRLWAPEVKRRRLAFAAFQREEDERRRQEIARDDSVRVSAERTWLAREREIARTTDIDALVQTSSDVVVAEAARAKPWERSRTLQVVEWLRSSGRRADRSGPLDLYVGQREDSVAKRWNECPTDMTPGSRPGEPLRCVAFLRFAHDPLPYFAPVAAYRLTDGDAGLLLANASTVARVRSALARRGARETAPRAGCGASLSEFAGLSEAEAAEVGVKVSSTAAFHLPDRPHAVVLGCPPFGNVQTALTTGWFAPCALPDERYEKDYVDGGWDLRAKPNEMKALLDSLVKLPSITARGVGPADSLSLMLRRLVGGRERVFECTLDGDAFLSLARVFSNVFIGSGDPPSTTINKSEDLTRINLFAWTQQIDSRAAPFWHPERHLESPRPGGQ